ncbi:hypothetical protein EON64_21085, partial [archaeon]
MDLHANLLQSLETALDTTKIFSVFTALMGIIKEQQEQIDTFGKRIDSLYNQPDEAIQSTGESTNNGAFQPQSCRSGVVFNPDVEKRLETIEYKIDEMVIALHGLGNEDPSILEAKEMTGYLAFETSALGMAATASFDMGEVSGSLVENPERYEPEDAVPPPGDSEGEEGLASRAETPDNEETTPPPPRQPEPPQLARPKTPEERNPTPEASLVATTVSKAPTPPKTPPIPKSTIPDTGGAVEEGSKGGEPQVLVGA